jgi:uncharacterized protein
MPDTHVRSMMLVTALAVFPGCGQIGPFGVKPTFADHERQLCVETALRREPDKDAIELAFDKFTLGCERGDAGACSALGVMYEQGLAVEQDGKRAFALFDQACRAGNDGGCVNLGKAYVDGVGADFNSRRAVELFTLGCDNGDMRGCTELAALYAVGDGVSRDTTKAAQLYAHACEGRQLDACYAVAKLHDDGIIGPDPITALSFYEKACVGGYEDSCDRMDRMYARRRPIGAIAEKARHPGEKACLRGDAAACNAAGVAYYAGAGVKKDTMRAATFLQRACDGSYEPACNVLGPLLHGACARGDSASCAAIKRLANK